MKHYNWLPIISLLLITFFSSAVIAKQKPPQSQAQLNNNLFAAIEAQDLMLTQTAIKNGASMDAVNAANETLLQVIFQQAQIKKNTKLSHIANYLIEQGYDIHQLNNNKTSYLHNAAEKNMLSTASILIEQGIDFTLFENSDINNEINSVLFYAKTKAMLTLLIEQNIGSFESLSINGNTLLHYASNTGADLIYLRYLLKNIPIETKNSHDETPLQYILKLNQTPKNTDELVGFFLANHANVNIMNKNQRNPLQIALRNKNLSTATIKKLIKAGANLSHQDIDGIQAIHFSAASHFDYLKLLYSHGMDLNATTGKENKTPLIIASQNNLKDTVKYLLKHKVKLNTQDTEGKTALNYALENDFSDIVMMLEEKKAKATPEKDITLTALSTLKRHEKEFHNKKFDIKTLNDAIKNKNLIQVKKHLSSRIHNTKKPPVNFFNLAKFTIEHGNSEIFNYLITKGLDIHKKNEEDYTLLHYAVFNNNLRIAKILIYKKLDVNAISNDGKSVFMMSSNSSLAMINILLKSNIKTDKAKDSHIVSEAIHYAKPAIAEYFIKKGYSFSIKNFESNATLISLISNEETDTLSLLIKQGLNINTLVTFDNRTSTLLHLAIMLNKHNLSKFLIKTGADVNARNKRETAIFEDAVSMGDIAVLKAVYEHGGLLNDTSGESKRTPIHVALDLHQIKAIQFLIDRGADLNIAETINKNTPLHIAAEKGYLDIIKRMLKRGAKPNTLNSNNESAFDLAVKFKQEAVQRYLSAL